MERAPRLEFAVQESSLGRDCLAGGDARNVSGVSEPGKGLTRPIPGSLDPWIPGWKGRGGGYTGVCVTPESHPIP